MIASQLLPIMLLKNQESSGDSKTLHQGNFDKSSKQMEHAILIAIINKITPILDQHDMLLDICVDGDLDSIKL